MAIPNINRFNSDRQDLLKIKTINDDIILFSKEEAKEALTTYITEELNFFADDVGSSVKSKLEQRINFKLKQIELSLIKHIDKKLDDVCEKIISNSTSRVIEEEVNKRVDIKLNKIKSQL